MKQDVFKKFTNKDGKFKETLTKDVQGLLSLYEAAHLRVHGEEILEQGLNFTISHLKSMAPKLSNSLKSQISEALSQPVHINLPRFGAKTYMSLYENDESHNDLLLKFAKLDFNIVQKVYQSELYELTRYWWKDLDYANKFPYARDRLVECYYGAVGVLFEPQYSRTRKILGKLINIITMVDDTFDAYATFDEIVAFTDAMQRLDISAIDSVPVNLRPSYQVLVDFFNEIGQELAKEGKADRVYYAKFEMKKWIRAYFKEAQWLNAGYIPKCDEYLENGSVSVGITLIAVTSLVCLEELITKETLEWVINDPLILRTSGVISRLKDDIIGHVFEQKRGHVASFIECYMKEYGASKQEAYAAAEKEMANAWKDINTEFLRPSQVSMFGLEQIINPTRLVIGFQENDFINTQGEYKDKITSLLVDSVKI
uniref:(E,E)-germacrene B synthase-like n=1 Tax=Nicotiana tabacum TaxID=4097 RepID=A0A1S4BE58_TOBAC|nr:PREDICTED: (E,E)-germacrene B synthase-like [Nicotiana tabacum]